MKKIELADISRLKMDLVGWQLSDCENHHGRTMLNGIEEAPFKGEEAT